MKIIAIFLISAIFAVLDEINTWTITPYYIYNRKLDWAHSRQNFCQMLSFPRKWDPGIFRIDGNSENDDFMEKLTENE